MLVHELPEPVRIEVLIRVDDHDQWVPALAHALRKTESSHTDVLVDPDCPFYNEQWVPRARVRPVLARGDCA